MSAPDRDMRSSALDAARSALESGDLDTAEERIRLAIKEDNRNAVAHAYHAEILAAKGRLDGAVKAYENAVALKPENAILWNGLGLAYFRARRLEDALAVLNRAASLQPDMPEIQNNLGNPFQGDRRPKTGNSVL
jgi:Flp pilus assembly protein TadD